MSKPSARIVSVGTGVFRIEQDDGSHAIVYAVRDGTRTWVFHEGVTYVLEHAPRRRDSGGQDASAFAAPMPATVTLIHVAAGQQVRSGDVLITLEAMKMELSIRANADGTVTAIHCHVGELVEPGVPLVEMGGDG